MAAILNLVVIFGTPFISPDCLGNLYEPATNKIIENQTCSIPSLTDLEVPMIIHGRQIAAINSRPVWIRCSFLAITSNNVYRHMKKSLVIIIILRLVITLIYCRAMII